MESSNKIDYGELIGKIAHGIEKAALYTAKKASKFKDPEYRANIKKQSEELWEKAKNKWKLAEKDKDKFMEAYKKASETYKKLDSKEFRQELNDKLNKAIGSESSKVD